MKLDEEESSRKIKTLKNVTSPMVLLSLYENQK
jgi:hypothetical protein